MDINAGNINALTSTVSLALNKYLTTGPSLYQKFCQIVPSTAGENFYPRLAELPGLRKWVGDRVVNQLQVSSFAIPNVTYEETIAVRREDIEDDRWGVLQPFIEQIGADAAEVPDQLVFSVLQNGGSLVCPDGQYFFDSDHAATNSDGKSVLFQNYSTPNATLNETAGAYWYALCTVRPLKPVIYQPRRAFTVTARTALSSGNVFHGNRFEWGVDGRCAAGPGLWQLAYRSNRPLYQQSWSDVRSAMASLCRLDGTPYGILPNLLVVPTNLEQQARQLLMSEFAPQTLTAGGTPVTGSNPWRGSAELLVAPRLSQSVGA